MSITVSEMAKGRTLGGLKEHRDYLIRGATNESDALNALLTTGDAPAMMGAWGMLVTECTAEEVEPNLYLGKAVWVSPGISAYQGVGQFSISFDIAGTSQRITQSKKLIAEGTSASLSIPRLFNGAINVNEDGTVEGTEILFPTPTFTCTYTAAPASITQTYFRLICTMVGKTNQAPWQGFDTRELLLTRVSGQRRDFANWDITFGFGFSENKTGVVVGDCIAVDKKGWEYLWVYYVTKNDTANHVLTKMPANTFVEQVYDDGDFGLLGIPTT